jgi:hypothetical protein
MSLLTRPTGIVSVVTIICLTFAGGLILRTTRRGPPGPKGLPILGNALAPLNIDGISSVPGERNTVRDIINHLDIIYVIARSGDIIGLSALGTRIVVLNSRK